jgi:hypothetical protein
MRQVRHGHIGHTPKGVCDPCDPKRTPLTAVTNWPHVSKCDPCDRLLQQTLVEHPLDQHVALRTSHTWPDR